MKRWRHKQKVMDQFAFFKDLYLKEEDRRIAINDSLSIPIAVITALVSIAFFLLTTYDYSQHGVVTWLFVLLVGTSIILIFVSVYSLIRAFSNLIHGYKYKGLPYPQDLLNWHKELVKYYTAEDGGFVQAEDEYQKHLIDEFAAYASFNMKVNDRKSKHLFIAKKFMVLSLVCLTVACFPYSYNYLHKATAAPMDKVTNSDQQSNTAT
jgi:hypothetical protein